MKAKKRTSRPGTTATVDASWVLLGGGIALAAILLTYYNGGEGEQDLSRVPARLPTSHVSGGIQHNKLPLTRTHVAQAFLEIRETNGSTRVFVCSSSARIRRGTVLTRYGDRDVPFSEISQHDQAEVAYPMRNPLYPDLLRAGSLWRGGSPHPIRDEGLHVGHLLNDAARVNIPSPAHGGPLLGLQGLRRLVREYQHKAWSLSNVEFVEGAKGGSWDMEATRDLTPGQELYYPRGASYWVQMLSRSPETHPLTRLLTYLYSIEVGLMSGYYLVVGEGGLVLVAGLHREATEQQCRELLVDQLGFRSYRGRAAMVRAGAGEGMSYKERLVRLVQLVSNPDVDTEQRRHTAAQIEEEGERQVPPQSLPTATAFLEVRQSSIAGAGLGVFVHSTAPVAEGTVLTQYGGHDMPAHLVASTEYAISIPGAVKGLYHVGQPWAGSVPARVAHGVHVGHIVNDGGAIIRPPVTASEPFLSKRRLDELAAHYDASSLARVNVRAPSDPANGNWDMTADRELQPGEELFWVYGDLYWVGRLQIAVQDCPLSRLSVYLYLLERGPHVLQQEARMLSWDEEGRIVILGTRQEVDDNYVREFLQGSMGFVGGRAEEIMASAGITSDWKDRLMHLVRYVST